MSSGSVRPGFKAHIRGNLELVTWRRQKKSHESATKCQLFEESHVATGRKLGSTDRVGNQTESNCISEHLNRDEILRLSTNNGQWADGAKMASGKMERSTATDDETLRRAEDEKKQKGHGEEGGGMGRMNENGFWLYLPDLVLTISVPSPWNFSQSSLDSRLTLGSSVTPSSSGGRARSGLR